MDGHYSVAPGQIAQLLPSEGHVIDEVEDNLNPGSAVRLLTPNLSPRQLQP
jgi:hypothetical protein